MYAGLGLAAQTVICSYACMSVVLLSHVVATQSRARDYTDRNTDTLLLHKAGHETTWTVTLTCCYYTKQGTRQHGS